MGGVQSNSIVQMAQIVNSAVNQSVNQTTNLTTQDCVSSQNLTFNLCTQAACGPSPPQNCGAYQNDFANSGTQSCTLNSSSVSQLSSNFTDNVSNAVQQAVQQSASIVSGWMATSVGYQSQFSNSTTNVGNYLANIVKNISYSDSVNAMLSDQAQVINVCGSFYGNNVSNNVQQNALVSNVTNLVMNSLSSDSIYNSLSQYAKQQTTAQFGGLGLGGFIGVIVGACVLLLLFGGIWYYKRRHSTIGSTTRVPPKEIEMQTMATVKPSQGANPIGSTKQSS